MKLHNVGLWDGRHIVVESDTPHVTVSNICSHMCAYCSVATRVSRHLIFKMIVSLLFIVNLIFEMVYGLEEEERSFSSTSSVSSTDWRYLRGGGGWNGWREYPEFDTDEGWESNEEGEEEEDNFNPYLQWLPPVPPPSPDRPQEEEDQVVPEELWRPWVDR